MSAHTITKERSDRVVRSGERDRWVWTCACGAMGDDERSMLVHTALGRIEARRQRTLYADGYNAAFNDGIDAAIEELMMLVGGS